MNKQNTIESRLTGEQLKKWRAVNNHLSGRNIGTPVIKKTRNGSCTIVTMIMIVLSVLFTFGCTEPYGLMDDPGTELEFEPDWNDDEDITNNQDDDEEPEDDGDYLSYARMAFTDAYHSSEHFVVHDLNAVVTLGTIQITNTTASDIRMVGVDGELMVQHNYNPNYPFAVGSHDWLFANDLISYCYLKSWPDSSAHRSDWGYPNISGSVWFNLGNDGPIIHKDGTDLVFDVVCKLHQELDYIVDVAVAMEFGPMAAIAKDHDTNELIDVYTADHNGNPPTVAAIIEANE